MPKPVLNDDLMQTIAFVLSHEFTPADVAQHLTEVHDLDDAIHIAEYCIAVFNDENQAEKTAYWRQVLSFLTAE